MDNQTKVWLWELGKTAIQQGILFARMAGKTAEERAAAFEQANSRFDAATATPLTPPPPKEEGGTS